MPNTNEFNTSQLAQARLVSIVPAIARGLGYVVSRQDADTAHYIQLQDPANPIRQIGLHVGFPYGRVTISAQFQHRDAKGKEVFSVPYGTPTPSITASLAKSGEQIAQDIARRLVPDALPLWDKNVERLAEWAKIDDVVTAGVKFLCGVVGAPIPAQRRHDSSTPDTVGLYHSKAFPGDLADLRVGYTGEVEIKGLRVSQHEAEVLLRTLMGLRADE